MIQESQLFNCGYVCLEYEDSSLLQIGFKVWCLNSKMIMQSIDDLCGVQYIYE